MKPLKLSAVAAVLFLSSSLSLSTHADNGALAPNWALDAADGSTVRLSREVREQPVILLFWASWCPYCKALMPHLQSIELEYGDRVQILAINFRDKGDALSFVQQAGYDFTVLPAGEEVAKLYDVWATPGVIIVDQEQRIRFDLRDLPDFRPATVDQLDGNASKAAHRAPYWAAEIRKTLDEITSK